MNVERFAEAAPSLLTVLLRTGGTYADLFYEHAVAHRHDLRQRLLGRHLGSPRRRQRTHVLHGTGLRVLAGSAQGFAVADGWDATTLRKAAEHAGAAFDASGPTHSANVLSPPSSIEPPELPPPTTSDALLDAAADAAFALDDAVRHVRVTSQMRLRRVAVATTEGVLSSKAQSLTGLRVEVMLSHDGGVVTAHAVAGGTTAPDLKEAELAAREAVQHARMLAAAKPLPGGRMPVVLAAGWGGVWLHEAIGHLLEADVMSEGPFVERLGQRVAAPGVTLVDDGSLARGRATAPFDDEGTPTRRTILIDGGILTGILADRRHRSNDAPLTGNARRQDYRSPPLPRMTNLCLLPGEAASNELIGAIDQGLYVEMLGGGRVWPDRHRFTFDVLAGRRIERGRLTHSVAGLRVTGHVPDVLHRLALACDARLDAARGVCAKHGQTVPVSVSMPSVRLDGLDVVCNERTTHETTVRHPASSM